MKRILIVDDHLMIAKSLAFHLQHTDENIEVDALEKMSQAFEVFENGTRYDLVLLDYDMPVMNGLEGLKILKQRYPEQIVGMISGVTDAQAFQLCMQNGAIGWISKSMAPDPLVHAINMMAAGGEFIPRNIQLDIQKEQHKWANFTLIEQQVAQQVAVGSSDKEIAGDLGLPLRTVQHHVRCILKKAQSKNRTTFALDFRD